MNTIINIIAPSKKVQFKQMSQIRSFISINKQGFKTIFDILKLVKDGLSAGIFNEGIVGG